MATDFTQYEFVAGRTYSIEIDANPHAVQLTHHGEGQPMSQTRYESLEYEGPVGSGPWRKFQDWESETEVTIDSHHIVAVDE
jgi:hypothetical protein